MSGEDAGYLLFAFMWKELPLERKQSAITMVSEELCKEVKQ